MNLDALTARLVVCLAISVPALGAQDTLPSFEVASVKVSPRPAADARLPDHTAPTADDSRMDEYGDVRHYRQSAGGHASRPTNADAPAVTGERFQLKLGEMVVDQTGINGTYHVELDWDPEDAPPGN